MNCRLLLLLMLFGAFGINQSLGQTIAAFDRRDQVDAAVQKVSSGNTGEGIRELASLAQGENPNVDAIVWLGIFAVQSGQLEKARERFSEALVLEPGQSEATWQLAMLEMEEGAYNRAVVGFEAVMSQDSSYANGLFFTARCYEAMGNQDEARIRYETYLPYAPDTVIEQRVLEIIQRLTESAGLSASEDPPILSIDPSTIRLTDVNPNQSLAGNGALDAMDRADLSFIIENTGPGPGRNLYADVSISGATDGLTWVSPWPMPDIPPGTSEEASSYTILSDRKTVDGVIEVTIEVIEPNGFSPEPFKVEIETRAFRAPKLEVVDFTSSFSTWKPNAPIGLDILIQNTGIGIAQDLTVELTLPDAVNCYSNNTSIEVASLAPGETIPITYDMMVPRNFDQSRVQANLTVTETFGDYGTNWTHGFPFEGGTSNGAVVSIDAAAADGEVSTERAALIKNNSKPSDVTFNKTDKEHNITAVAVIGKMVTGCDGNSKSADELASFTENNVLAHYEVIERRHFEDLLNEHRLQMSGLTFEETLIEKGCIENAQGYLFVESGCLMGDEMIQLKLVHCESSDLVWSCTGINATAKETLDKVSEELEHEKN